MESILAVAAVVSLLVQGLRKLPATAPLWRRIPDGWRWAPPLLLAFAGTVCERLLAGAPLWPQSVTAALAAVVVTWLASMGVAAGAKEVTAGKDSTPPTLRSTTLTLLFLGILFAGCASASRVDPCSPAAFEALSGTCEAEILSAPTDAEARVALAACVAATSAWAQRCGGDS